MLGSPGFVIPANSDESFGARDEAGEVPNRRLFIPAPACDRAQPRQWSRSSQADRTGSAPRHVELPQHLRHFLLVRKRAIAVVGAFAQDKTVDDALQRVGRQLRVRHDDRPGRSRGSSHPSLKRGASWAAEVQWLRARRRSSRHHHRAALRLGPLVAGRAACGGDTRPGGGTPPAAARSRASTAKLIWKSAIVMSAPANQ